MQTNIYSPQDGMLTVGTHRMPPVKDYLKENVLVTDGAFGTYYAGLYQTQELPEFACIDFPDRVSGIHRQYADAGAKLIRTNTYAANTVSMKKNTEETSAYIRAACRLACEFQGIYAAGDIGPIPYGNMQEREQAISEYTGIAKTMLECSLPIIVFETFSQLDEILPAIHYIKSCSDTFVIVQYAVNQYGYSSAGLSARRLFADACCCEQIDAVGLNCGVGPGHMRQILSKVIPTCSKYVTALPNAGYPQNVSNRMIFIPNNSSYFAAKTAEIADIGACIVGGCCGTTPAYIKALSGAVKDHAVVHQKEIASCKTAVKNVENNAFFAHQNGNKKLIAVELAPPFDSDDQKLMEAAHILQKSEADVVTFPDSPSGRTRADSLLMAEKVAKETGLCVMPHLCCRDKNAIAMRSQLLGAHLNNIKNFLVITGDPVPSMARQSAKSVFHFDSVGLMNLINDMNTEHFSASPICYGGAINQNRRNLTVEIERVHKKMHAGASFFLTQPVFDADGAKRLECFKQQTGARILCGIMPLVSYANALFMKNEMTGIDISEQIIQRYENCSTKEEGEAVGIAIAKEVIDLTKQFVDGYYFSFPFNRVYLLEKIIGHP